MIRTLKSVALALMGIVGTEGASAAQPEYLAIGDSLTFGYSPLVFLNHANVAAGRFPGFPEEIALLTDFKVTNAACPGETSRSFIDANAGDNGCRSGPYPTKPFTKVAYDTDQLTFAKDFLQTHPDTKLVSLILGGNDFFVAERLCSLTPDPAQCALEAIPPTIASIAANVKTIVMALRNVGYSGQIVVGSIYALDYNNPVQQLSNGGLDARLSELAQELQVSFLSSYKVFKEASQAFDGDSCKAGLVIIRQNGACDVHPSASGRKVLADALLNLVAN